MTKRKAESEPTGPLFEVKSAAVEIEYAQDARDRWIVQAFNDRDGFTVDDIADAAGLSRARIYQIVDEANRDEV